MTTLAVNTPRAYPLGNINELPMIANDIIYEGAAVGDNASGYMRPLVAGDAFRGFAVEKTDNTGGSAGDINVKLYKRGEVVLTVVGSSALTDVGSYVYASDDATFTLTAGSNTHIGEVVRWVSGTTCEVYFDAIKYRNSSIVNADINASAAIVGSKISPTFTLQAYAKTTVATITTAGAGTYSAANLLGGLILRDPAGDNRTDTTGTAAAIVAAIPNAVVGSSVRVTIRNDADAAETITVAGGSGVTISGTATIAQNNSKTFLLVCTNVTGSSEAVTMYSLGTAVH